MKRKIFCILFFLTTIFSWKVSHADVATEDKVKAAYVYHIINFVTWPENALAGSTRPITICLIGEVEIQRSLFSLQNREIRKHIIEVRQITSAEQETGCLILYIGGYSLQSVQEIIQNTQGRAILTLGDFPGFVEAGGMIGFTKRGNNVKLEINLDAANKSGITISAKLAEVAVNVIGGPEQQ